MHELIFINRIPTKIGTCTLHMNTKPCDTKHLLHWFSLQSSRSQLHCSYCCSFTNNLSCTALRRSFPGTVQRHQHGTNNEQTMYISYENSNTNFTGFVRMPSAGTFLAGASLSFCLSFVRGFTFPAHLRFLQRKK